MKAFLAFLRYLLALIAGLTLIFAGFQFLAIIVLAIFALYRWLIKKKPEPFKPRIIDTTSKTSWHERTAA